ncbi:MAG: CDP-glycerol glycerophosphotransferase family protein [Desulfovibrionaceae bacterium]|nr:CDP-glycerol glycerophosphotransferase family protein [Desulfovibrionaceae bacterium]
MKKFYKISFFFNIICIALGILLYPLEAHAYMDPGTGNALVYGIISLAGAGIYALKNIFYRMIAPKSMSQTTNAISKEQTRQLVIFSEGKNYWGTFKPIIEALLHKKIYFRYLTQDIHDPALLIDSNYMDSRYIGNGSMGAFHMNHVNADILLSTTPNIGMPGYPITRSAKVRCMIHVWHSFGDFAYAWYHRGGLDWYDTILTTSSSMEKQIRLIEHKRNLPAKNCVICGVPYLDGMHQKAITADAALKNDGKTILIAPSWGEKGCLSVYGTDFVAELAQAGFTVLIRPHPQSLKTEKALFDSFKRKLAEYPQVEWDEDVDGFASLQRAALMISDTSSVRLDFAVLYQRPVLSLEMPLAGLGGYEYADLKELLAESAMEQEIGRKVSRAQMSDIVTIVREVLDSFRPETFAALRDKYAANFGHAGEAVADYLIAELQK